MCRTLDHGTESDRNNWKQTDDSDPFEVNPSSISTGPCFNRDCF